MLVALNKTVQEKYLVQQMLVFISIVAGSRVVDHVMGNQLFSIEFHGYLLSINFVLVSAPKELTV